MRCWVFDWPGRRYVKPAQPGGRPPFLPDITLDFPARWWVHDSPGADTRIWAQSTLSGIDPEVLLQGQPGAAPFDDQQVLAAIQQKWAGANVVAARAPGERHPRIWRGRYLEPPREEAESLTASFSSAHALIDRFRHVLRTVEPHEANRSTFGHELRHLLILGCTEVESAWKSILVANDYPAPPKNRHTTNDYWKLRDALRLEEWEVQLALFPRYGTVAPFRGWDRAKPTDSLAWYAGYNATKHDREVNLDKASLENVISALAAVYIMLAAQMGPDWLRKAPYEIPDFHPTNQPAWDLAEEYVPIISFSSKPEPTAVPYKFPP